MKLVQNIKYCLKFYFVYQRDLNATVFRVKGHLSLVMINDIGLVFIITHYNKHNSSNLTSTDYFHSLHISFKAEWHKYTNLYKHLHKGMEFNDYNKITFWHSLSKWVFPDHKKTIKKNTFHSIINNINITNRHCIFTVSFYFFWRGRKGQFKCDYWIL